MSMAAMIRAMAAAGANAEAIAIAVEALEAGARADADRREKQAERKRRSRIMKELDNVTVTGQSRDDGVTMRDNTVTRADKDPSPLLLSPHTPLITTPHPVDPRLPSEVAPKGASASRGSTLPDDWEPKDRHFAKAAEKGLNGAFIADLASRMREWAGANSNRAIARKANWDLTFDGFIRREMEKQPSRAGPGDRRDPALQAREEILQEMGLPWQPH